MNSLFSSNTIYDFSNSLDNINKLIYLWQNLKLTEQLFIFFLFSIYDNI